MRCDVCGGAVEGGAGGRGLLVFPRGDEARYEEPPLCARCAQAVDWAAAMRFAEEEDG